MAKRQDGSGGDVGTEARAAQQVSSDAQLIYRIDQTLGKWRSFGRLHDHSDARPNIRSCGTETALRRLVTAQIHSTGGRDGSGNTTLDVGRSHSDYHSARFGLALK